MRGERDDSDGFEYRLMERDPNSTLELFNQWRVVHTNRGNGRPFRSLSAARGERTRQINQVERRRVGMNLKPAREFKIQKRPVEAKWEDVE